MGDATAAADRSGGLSIVVQGPIDRESVAGMAEHCRAWRRLFRAAEIVVAVSSSDGADPEPVAGVCDRIVFASDQPALPPIKTDNPSPNNVNRMIAAARAGIAAATGEYLLRIRSDLMFGNRAFLALYDDEVSRPRGDWAVFEQRVLIAEVFTLNPFTHARMPFHYSDWFHFGLRQDVQAIWDAARPMTPDDAIYYTRHPHRLGANAVERRFLSRLAPEQTVHFPAIARAFPDLRLTTHDDVSNVEESVLVLIDNFVLANFAACGARIAKYQHIVDRMSLYTRLECLSQPLLRARAASRNKDARSVFAHQIAATARYNAAPARAWRAIRSAALRRWQRR